MTLSYNGTTVTGVTFNGTVCSSVICNGTTVFTAGPTSLAMAGENVFPFTTNGRGTLYTVPSALTTEVSDTIFSSTTTLANKIIVKKTASDALQVYNFANGWGTALTGMTSVYCHSMDLIPAGNVLFTANTTTLAIDAYAFSSSGIGTKYASSPTGTDRNTLTVLPDGSGILLWQRLTGVRLRRIAWSNGWSTSTNLQSYEDVNSNVTVTSNCDVIFYTSGTSGLMYKLNATSLGTKYNDPASGILSNATGACFNPARSVFVKTISTNNPVYWQWSYASGFGTLSAISTPTITAAYNPVFLHTGNRLLMNGANGSGYAWNWSGTSIGTALTNGGPYNINNVRVSVCGTP